MRKASFRAALAGAVVALALAGPSCHRRGTGHRDALRGPGAHRPPRGRRAAVARGVAEEGLQDDEGPAAAGPRGRRDARWPKPACPGSSARSMRPTVGLLALQDAPRRAPTRRLASPPLQERPLDAVGRWASLPRSRRRRRAAHDLARQAPSEASAFHRSFTASAPNRSTTTSRPRRLAGRRGPPRARWMACQALAAAPLPKRFAPGGRGAARIGALCAKSDRLKIVAAAGTDHQATATASRRFAERTGTRRPRALRRLARGRRAASGSAGRQPRARAGGSTGRGCYHRALRGD